MKRLKKISSILGKGLVFCIILCALSALSDKVLAAEHKKVVVAYIDYSNFVTKSEDGSYRGYGVEYLNNIAQLTGFHYEYVEMDWPTAYEAVKNGTVDFYCVARQTEKRQDDFDFSLYPICNERMNIYTMPDTEIYYEDFATMKGKKVGMLKDSSEITYFKKYETENDFDCKIVEYSMNEDAIKALNAGEVDMVALVNYSVKGELKLIGNFGIAPAYVMSCQGSKYMAQFSEAQEKLYFDNPSFMTNLEEQYYKESGQNANLMLTRDETEYIEDIKKKGKPLNVAVSKDMAPIEYYDESTKAYKGLTIDIYSKISELTGLTFNFVNREKKEKMISMMKNDEATLVGAMAQNMVVAKELSLTQTRAFSENMLSIVAKDIAGLSKDSVVAVPIGYPQFYEAAKNNGYTKLMEYSSFEDCVKAVDDGEADFTYIISMCEGYLLDHASYSDLKAIACEGTDYGICFGVYKKCDTKLISIINKCIAAISSREVNDMVISNTATAKPPQTFRDFIKNNSIMIMIIAIIIIAFSTAAVIRFQKSRQQMQINKNLKQHQDYLQHLYDTLPCGVFRYEYETPHKIISFNESCAKIYGYDGDFSVIGKRPDVVVAAGTEDAFQEKFAECERMAKPTIYEWPITRKDGSQAYTESVMDIVETQEGKIFQEVIIDITDRKCREIETERLYTNELNRTGSHEEGLLFTACIDITDHLIVQTDIDVNGIVPGISVSKFIELLKPDLCELQSEEWFNEYGQELTASKMEEAYENAQFEKSIKLCRRKDDKLQWLRSDLTLRHHPGNGHLMCFNYIWDITDEYVSETITRHTALVDCESFMNIDMKTTNCLQYDVDKKGEIVRAETKYGSTDLTRQLAEQMTTQDAKEFLKATQLSTIEKQLEDNLHYQIYATLHGEDDIRSDKSLTFFYMDKEKGILAMTKKDVTEVRASEVQHAQLLVDALRTAEKADAAKSQFLSRVSHEMRTPLNAIIGFIELAKDADEEKTANCLVSSDIAAKQLLSVINDVLDMSSIESGKMKISYSSFNIKHLLTSITNIYGTQCKQKNINFEAIITNPVEEWLVGDELRVNQILINLLGNACKFTEKGYIHLIISQNVVEENKVFIKFSVTDTGCGMSEEMKERLFKPFEQESASTARKYGGSGLGLSIVKSLVKLMDGTINVESKQGEGTTFEVELPFCKSDVIEHMILPKKVNKLHILTVDDEPSEREYMNLVLKRMGVRFKSVCGGEEALHELAESEKKDDLYNVCLIDWRMPGMNGCETTKKIREKYGKDLIVIVVSAYDFQHAGEMATKAGANLFLSKPIFQSSLYDLFMTLTDGKLAEPKKESQAWDFTGKRILLAEDNELNQIVAKGYLAKYNVVVDLAVDGSKAVEMFEASKPGFYDAVLMDIQMPIMDGYEATKAIRASSHPEAKTIQIIAQSADAFNEDIAKALSAGMDDHVSKPIKQDILAKALYKAFESKEKENTDD